MDRSWTTRCGNSNGCITVTKSITSDNVLIKASGMILIEVTMADWKQLAAAVKAGELDHIGVDGE